MCNELTKKEIESSDLFKKQLVHHTKNLNKHIANMKGKIARLETELQSIKYLKKLDDKFTKEFDFIKTAIENLKG